MLKYPYYQDNPKLKLVVVQTVHGTTEYLSNCKKYPEGYLVKGKDLDLVNDVWVKKEKLIFDYETKSYVTSVLKLIKGIIGFDVNNNPIYGYFSPNPYNNCYIVYKGRTQTFINVNFLPSNYVEKISAGVYYNITELSAQDIRQLSVKKLALDNANHVYNAEDNMAFFTKAIELYEHSTIPLDKDIKYLSTYIKDFTFGVELETINGTLPQHIMNKYGVIICKDGSIKDDRGKYPPEYVTVPLKGAKGLQTLRNLSKEISKRSSVDIKCSYHVHIGGMDIDRIFMVSLFNLCTKIQDDVFKMFPYYKTKPEGIKEKNYCKKLPYILSSCGSSNFNTYINSSFEDIYMFLSGGVKMCGDFNRKNKHNPWGGEKWTIKTRYYWVNFVNPLFGKRDTIEFRIHTPTLNSDKIINWLMMCIAIIKFAETKVKVCISKNKIPFTDVLNIFSLMRKSSYSLFLTRKLKEYYNNRVEYFAKDFKNGDYISEKELLSDDTFEFNISKIK